MRTNGHEIRERRIRRDSRILVTGATGFLGSHLAVGLLQRGYKVFLLARPGKNLTARERINCLLEWFGMESEDLQNLRVLEGHLEDDHLGQCRERWEKLREGVDEIIHCACDTSFSERKRKDVERANVASLENLLGFAAGSRCSFLHHISTVYVAGKRKGVCREEMSEAGEFTNVYEETKHLGEWMALKRCEAEGIRISIYRPSIVYGDSRTGRTFRFTALYYPLRAVSFFRDLFLKDIIEDSGRKAWKLGISLDADGDLHMPIRLASSNGGGINLIPVDFFVQAFIPIMEEEVEGGVFHIVNPRTKSIPELIDYLRRFLRIRGITAVSEEVFREVPRNGMEILFGHSVEAYLPYIRDERVFESPRTDAILGNRGISCPEFDYEVFSRCLGYALGTDWGKKLAIG